MGRRVWNGCARCAGYRPNPSSAAPQALDPGMRSRATGRLPGSSSVGVSWRPSAMAIFLHACNHRDGYPLCGLPDAVGAAVVQTSRPGKSTVRGMEANILPIGESPGPDVPPMGYGAVDSFVVFSWVTAAGTVAGSAGCRAAPGVAAWIGARVEWSFAPDLGSQDNVPVSPTGTFPAGCSQWTFVKSVDCDRLRKLFGE